MCEDPWPSVCFFICIFMKESLYLLLYILNSNSTERRNVHKYPCHLTSTNIRPIQQYVNYNRERTDRYFVRTFVVYISICKFTCKAVYTFIFRLYNGNSCFHIHKSPLSLSKRTNASSIRVSSMVRCIKLREYFERNVF